VTRWLLDTSVAIPALVENHPAHAACVSATVGRDVVLATHSALETYSVLTRLPGDARLVPGDAARLLAARFGSPVPLPVERAIGLVDELAGLGVAAGATYDALIGLTAASGERVLLTRDRRAAATYSRLGVAHTFVT
jgi:predicted nucleic acid-binding protein